MNSKKAYKYLTGLLFLAILSLATSQCSYRHLSGFVEGTEAMGSDLKLFKNDSIRYVYRSNLSILNHHLSGLIVIKKIPGRNGTQVVFVSEIGMKYFDFEYTDGQNTAAFSCHYLMESLQHHKIQSRLRSLMQMLVMQYPHSVKAAYFKHPNTGEFEITYAIDGKINSYLFSDDGLAYQIIQHSKTDQLVNIEVESRLNEASPSSINIKSKRPGIKLQMQALNH